MGAVDGYSERAAASPLLTCVWSLSSSGPHERRITPDGCVDVMWGPESFWVAGPDTRAQLNSTRGELIVGVRFAPGAAPAALGVPAQELRDARVPLDAVLPHARLLAERVGAAVEGRGVVAAQQVLADALTSGAGERVDAQLMRARALLQRGVSVSRTAQQLGLSERQLHRRSLAGFGYSAKTLQRVLRFRRALTMARGGEAFAEVAYACGYADQAHLAREVRELAGVPLGELVSPVARRPAA